MNLPLSHPLRRRMMAPANDRGDSGTGTGAAAEDDGSDFTPTADEDEDEGEGGPQPEPKAKAGRTDGEGADENDEGDDAGLRGEAVVDAVDDAAKNADGKPATATPRATKGGAIPLDRHEKILAKERQRREQLEAQLAASQAGKAVARHNDTLEKLENDLLALETQFNEKLAQGDTAGARELQTKIRHQNAQLIEATVEQRAAAATAAAVETVRYEAALERIEEAYPELNPDADEYDQDLADDVIDMMNAGKARGLSPAKALQRAVTRLLGAKGAKQETATTVTPRVDESQVESAAAERKAGAVKRNIDASRRQPPGHQAGQSGAALGGALTAKSVMSLSDEEFAKLSDKDLARLDGSLVG
jgi:hypothetical protein